MESLHDLYTRIHNDPVFEDLRSTGSNFVGGQGPFREPELMLIGEAPGKLENANKIPFVGIAGKNLNELLMKVNLNPRNIFITNIIKYWPQDSESNTRKPSKKEMEAARPYIMEEIEILNPMFVGLMGDTAIRTILSEQEYEGNVYSVNGKIFDDRFVALYHPAVLSYSPEKKAQVFEGYRKLKGYINKERHRV